MIALVDGPAKADRMLTTLGWRRRASTVSHSVPSHCGLISSGKGRRISTPRFTTTGKSPVSGRSEIKRRLDTAMLALARADRGADAAVREWRAYTGPLWRFPW